MKEESKEQIIQISSGFGPLEVREFVALLSAKVHEECERLAVEVSSESVYGPECAPRSVELVVKGTGVSQLRPWLGTHVLVAASSHRNKRGRKRWFVGVSLHPVLTSASAFRVDPATVEFRADRAGGPGGQHVNTTSSAVRAVHSGSGISVRVASQRSQSQNRKAALRRIEEILAARHEQGSSSARAGRHQSHYRFERGSAVCAWQLRRGQLICTEEHWPPRT